MRASRRFLQVALAAIVLFGAANAQLVPGRLVSGVWDGTGHTNGLNQMPSTYHNSDGWDITYLPVIIPGSGPQRLAGFEGVGGFNLDNNPPPSTFSLGIYDSTGAILSNPFVGNLFSSTINTTSSPAPWGSNQGFGSPFQSWRMQMFPPGGTSFVANGGSTIWIALFSNDPSSWTWAETNVSYPLGPDPVLLSSNPTSFIHMTDPPFNYAYGVAAVDVYFSSVPEPASIAALIVGLGILARRRRRP